MDLVSGQPGRQLIYRRERLVTQYLRVGFSEDGTWRTFSIDAKAGVDQALWKRHVAYLENFLTKPNYQSELKRLRIQERITEAKATLVHVSSPTYRASLVGMVGADPALV